VTSRSRLEQLLSSLADHAVAPAEAAELLSDLPSRDLGFARVDTHRELRQGDPEVILGPGKTPDQVARIALALAEAGASSVLVDAEIDDRPLRSGSFTGLRPIPLAIV
jgi:pyridinium-3,5-biscarboxylic acid mononucleotide synthase